MSYCYHADAIREGADVLASYADLEADLIKLAGFNLRALIDKLEAGYTIEAPTDDEKRKLYESQQYLLNKKRR